MFKLASLIAFADELEKIALKWDLIADPRIKGIAQGITRAVDLPRPAVQGMREALAASKVPRTVRLTGIGASRPGVAGKVTGLVPGAENIGLSTMHGQYLKAA